MSAHTVETLVVEGDALRARGRFGDAERVLREALALAEATFAADDDRIAGALNVLAVTFKYSGRFDEAEPLLLRALDILRDTPYEATILHNLGGLHHARGDYAAAEPFARRACELRARTSPDDHFALATDRAAHAAVLDGLGRADEAEALLRDALALFEREDEAYDVAVTLNNLAAIAQRQGDLDTADEQFSRALAIKESLLGPDHPDVAVTLNNLATVRLEQDDAAGAAAGFRRALGIFERVLDPSHPTLAVCRENLMACGAPVTGAPQPSNR